MTVAGLRARALSLTRPASRVRVGPNAGAALLALALLTPLAATNGGYFPTSWGWAALVPLWVSVLALSLAAEVRLSRLELAFLAALAALAGWILLSTLWTSSPTATVLEAERALVYPAGVLAALLLARRASASALLGGTWAAITIVCAYALATRLLPDRLGVFDAIAGYRLSAPVGYWNALGLFAAMGALLALGLAARARSLTVRGVAAASTVVLLPTLYFTFSRGAWIALGLGLQAAHALDPRRHQLAPAPLAAAPGFALAVFLAWRSGALTHQQAALGDAASEGHRLALILIGLAALAAAGAVALAFAERRAELVRPARRALAGALLLALVAALALVVVRYGSPPTLVRKAYDAFAAPPPESGTNLNERLFTFSGSGRLTQWRVALDEYRDHPWLGAGAGSYERYWLQHRTVAGKIRDAHSLYLETLAELGPAGLALLVAALALPLAAAVRARRHALVPAAFGAYAAYLVHAGVDWDWELTAVTLAALLCASAALIEARGSLSPPALTRPARAGALVAALALSALALVGIVGNDALVSSADAARAGSWEQAESQARKATRWAPWSAEPWQALGQAQLAQGDLEAARGSFERAIAKDGGDWELWLDLARASEGAEQEQALAQASLLNPLSPEVAQLRAELAELGTTQAGG